MYYTALFLKIFASQYEGMLFHPRTYDLLEPMECKWKQYVLLILVMVAVLWIYWKLWIMHIRWVDFIVCELHLNLLQKYNKCKILKYNLKYIKSNWEEMINIWECKNSEYFNEKKTYQVWILWDAHSNFHKLYNYFYID